VEHSAEHVASLLDKFFPASSSMDQAIAHIERGGYKMEFKADVLQQMLS